MNRLRHVPGSVLKCFGLATAFAFVLVVSVAQSAQAQDKIALVIGNSEYESVASLQNPRNDANDIAKVLEGIGFEVELMLDLNQIELIRAFQNFQRKSAQAEMAVVYYAGHGIEIDKKNYLVPVSAALQTDSDVFFEAVPLDTALLAVEGASKVSLVIVDACRDNPFSASMVMTSATRSIGRGLAVVEPQGNTLVAYAAREGTTASDGTGRNSPYAKALIEVLQEPGVEIGKLFRRVRDSVMRDTRNRQEPFVYGSLSAEDLFLNPPVEPEVVELAEPQPAAQPAQQFAALPQAAPQQPTQQRTGIDPSVDITFWNSIQTSSDPRMFEAYLETFPNGVFRALAEIKLDQLRREQNVDLTPEPQPTPTPAPAAQLPTTELAQSAVPQPQTPIPADEPEAERLALALPQAQVSPPVSEAPSRPAGLVIAPPSAPVVDQQATPAALPATPETPTDETAERVIAPVQPFVRNRDSIRLIQETLNALGFDSGRPDGVVGRRTRGAASAFQAAFNLPQTGDIDGTLHGQLAERISTDRTRLFIDYVDRFRPARNGLAEMEGAYCLYNADGSISDGLNGRATVCTHVRARSSRLLEVTNYFGHLRNAKGNLVFPIQTRARPQGEGAFVEDDGTTFTISNGVLRIGESVFVETEFPS